MLFTRHQNLTALTRYIVVCRKKSHESKFLKGKILLVEDNALNQQVASEIMTNLGLEVDIACNGQEAVDKVTGQDKSVYDLVLMDMHMPVLGGVEATRIIKETGKYDSLPIYALSADMFSDNLDVALDCGMAGYLEKKPISISKLTEVLQKHVKEEKPKARNVDDKQYDDSIVYGVDFEYFQKNVSSDVETLKSFLETFASMNTYFMDKLRVQIENNDFAGAGEALHSMIGASGSCGMFKLSKKLS